jgi:hypothetical protein
MRGWFFAGPEAPRLRNRVASSSNQCARKSLTHPSVAADCGLYERGRLILPGTTLEAQKLGQPIEFPPVLSMDGLASFALF